MTKTQTEGLWDPTIPGTLVRMRDTPGKRGWTTGQTRQSGSYLMVQVDFGPNERPFKRFSQLEPVKTEETVTNIITEGKFGGPKDLRRVLTYQKVRGGLTNVFYSMETTRASFHAHQFKPVLRFIESPVGRLLLADEVGLGKTVEAMYIWKELQARKLARRLLVVCPAMLRDKWRRDMENLFGINAERVDAGELLHKARRAVDRDSSLAFACIAGMEALRPPRDYTERENNKPRAVLARLMDETPATDDFALFDLVIIDEAHAMRNAGTLTNRLGRLLRDSAGHLLLLTATPIQISNENLAQLLRLLDEDRFIGQYVFKEMLEANAPIVRLTRQAWKLQADKEVLQKEVENARSNPYFRKDPVLAQIAEQLSRPEPLNADDRVDMARMAASRSLLDQYMCRTRKREVLTDRVVREAQVVEVSFSTYEKQIYNRVISRIRDTLQREQTNWQFPLITRQRQMASSLPAAVAAWQEQGMLSDWYWEDLGLVYEGEEDEPDALPDIDAPEGAEWDLPKLERQDQKYQKLLEVLRKLQHDEPGVKTVVFAFFRKTLEYLHRRLQADGIPAILLTGGMDDAPAVVERFARSTDVNVLLSSEVGSEGIDLQFCRCLVNYDLPWNPMRVEQRIGRLDRLGQKAERIAIVNLVANDTIEDRILYQLYNRIGLFKETIGDLEEILGEQTDHLLKEMLNPSLSDLERMRIEQELELTIRNRQEEERRLEQEAINLYGLSDYVMHRIDEMKQQHRWLGPEDIFHFVSDFFALHYPGTVLACDGPQVDGGTLRLSNEARLNLSNFLDRAKLPTMTYLGLSRHPVNISFDMREEHRGARDTERIDVSHPLVRWIQAAYDQQDRQLHPVSAMQITRDEAQSPPGDYVFAVHHWKFCGIRNEQILRFYALRRKDQQPLDSAVAERLVDSGARNGETIPNAVNVFGDYEGLIEAVERCDRALSDEFAVRLERFMAENEAACEQQEVSARQFAARRIRDLSSRIEQMEMTGKSRIIPALKGQIQKAQEQLEARRHKIEQYRKVDEEDNPLAVGVIRVV